MACDQNWYIGQFLINLIPNLLYANNSFSVQRTMKKCCVYTYFCGKKYNLLSLMGTKTFSKANFLTKFMFLCTETYICVRQTDKDWLKKQFKQYGHRSDLAQQQGFASCRHELITRRECVKLYSILSASTGLYFDLVW